MIADSGEYFETLHFASPELRHRIVAVADPPSSYAYLGTDTLDNIMLALRQLTPVEVYGFSEFTAKHRTFLLFSNTASSFEWMPLRLSREGATLRALAFQGAGTLFVVDIPLNPN